MQWQTVRQYHPQQWVLIEALKAHTETDKRILDELSVIQAYKDSPEAMRDYLRLHREDPNRELYVLNTNREAPNIQERRVLGLRVRS